MKSGIFNRLFIIKVLSALAAALILTTGFLSYRHQKSIDDRNLRATKDSIEVKFVSIVNGLGVKKEWIRKKQFKQLNISGIDSVFEVSVPADLPVGVILAELNKQFISDTITLNAVEKERRGNTDLLISADRQNRLFARFIYNRAFTRAQGKAAFVLTGLEDQDQKEQDRITQIPEQLTFLIIPSKENIELAKKIKLNRKEYAVFLNDDIKEPNYKLSGKFTKWRNVNSIKDIVAGFKETKFFIVDNSGNLGNPETYKMLEEEFLKRNIRLLKLSEFRKLEGSGDEDLINRFRVELTSGKGDRQGAFLMSVDDFNTVGGVFLELRKKGMKYVSLSETNILELP